MPKIDCWRVTINGQDPVDYIPGQSFTIESPDDVISLELVYHEEPGPGPDPDPDPVPTPVEEVNAVAQTGDSTPLAPFALLAILSVTSCAVFAYKRILNK